MADSKVANCRTCGALVFWLRNERTGKLAPVDAAVSGDGNLAVDLFAGTYGVVPAGQRGQQAGRLHTNHFVTCPQARTWSNAGRRG